MLGLLFIISVCFMAFIYSCYKYVIPAILLIYLLYSTCKKYNDIYVTRYSKLLVIFSFLCFIFSFIEFNYMDGGFTNLFNNLLMYLVMLVLSIVSFFLVFLLIFSIKDVKNKNKINNIRNDIANQNQEIKKID